MEGTVNKFQDDIKCEICEKVFISKKKLKQHVGYVHGNNKKKNIYVKFVPNLSKQRNKDHECESCGKLFSSTGNLKITFKQSMKAVKITIV